jgi:hypothetical protein
MGRGDSPQLSATVTINHEDSPLFNTGRYCAKGLFRDDLEAPW